MWRSDWRDAMTGSETETRRGAMSVFGPTPYLEKESEYSTKDRRTGGVNSIESQQTFQQTFQQSFYSSLGHLVVLETLLKILLESLLRFN